LEKKAGGSLYIYTLPVAGKCDFISSKFTVDINEQPYHGYGVSEKLIGGAVSTTHA